MSDNYYGEYQECLDEIKRLRSLVNRQEKDIDALKDLVLDMDRYWNWEPSCPDEDDFRYSLGSDIRERVSAVKKSVRQS